jgi:hypothetical protein
MSLLGDLEAKFVQPIIDKIIAALGPFGKVISQAGKIFTNFKSSFNKGVTLSSGIIAEINEWRNFKENIHVKQRVINLPIAIDKSQQLLDQIKAAWNSIVDLAKQIRDQVGGEQGDPVEEAESAVSDIEEGGAKGIQNLLSKFPKLAKGLEKLLGFFAIIIGALEAVESAIDDLTNILAAITGIREEIETGETIFLSQKNSRKTIALADGGSIKIRVGSLHSS